MWCSEYQSGNLEQNPSVLKSDGFIRDCRKGSVRAKFSRTDAVNRGGQFGAPKALRDVETVHESDGTRYFQEMHKRDMWENNRQALGRLRREQLQSFAR